MTEQPFSHVDSEGKLRMVDVSKKDPSVRTAEASCLVITDVDVSSLETSANGFEHVVAARLAGIQAAKRTANLIPLCHPLNLSDVQVDVVDHPRGVKVLSRIVTVNRTGVEMEALTGCCFAALSLVNSLVSIDPRVRFEEIVLEKKSGGKSADWGRAITS